MPEVPGLPGVVELKQGEAAPFAGGLFDHARLAEAAEALARKQAWALAMTAAEKRAAEMTLEASEARRSLRRWRRKTLALTLGSAGAAWGLGRRQPWVAAASLGLGAGGAILF